MGTTLLFGATGGVGRHIVRQADARGIAIRAAEPDWSDDPNADLDYERRETDIMTDDLASLMEGCDAVVSAIGLPRDPQTLACPPPLYTESAVRIVEAMRETGMKRLVVVSAAFADPAATIPAWFKAATTPLRRVFRQMGEMERILRVAADIEWTAVRPGWLLDRDLTEDYEVASGDLPPRTLRTRRADLAHFMLECAGSDAWVRQRPFVARRESIHLESPAALAEELQGI